MNPQQIKLWAVVEGHTEEAFVKRVLGPHLEIHGGPSVTERMGLEALREKCPRLNAWVQKLETLNQVNEAF